jgi:hypothetical protein
MNKHIKNSKTTYEKLQICQQILHAFNFRIKKQKAQNGSNCAKIILVCVSFTFPLRCTMRCVWNILEKILSTHHDNIRCIDKQNRWNYIK